MKELSVARIQIEGIDLTVVFDASFDSMTDAARQTAFAAIQTQFDRPTNLAVLWKDPSGKTRFLAAPHLHAFLRIAHYEQLAAQIPAR